MSTIISYSNLDMENLGVDVLDYAGRWFGRLFAGSLPYLVSIYVLAKGFEIGLFSS